MKNKKHSKKNHNYRHNREHLALDENAIDNFYVIKRETAFQQLMDILCKGEEFIADMSCFNGHEEERAQVIQKVQRFLAIRAEINRNPSLVDCSGKLNRVA